MIENTAEQAYGSWSVPDASFKIEYPLELMDEIRLMVSSSFLSNSRGAASGGGVFFGTHRDDGVRVELWRPLPHENPAADLSEKDVADLEFLLWSTQTDAAGTPLEPVGWFIPHPRGTLEPSERDRTIFAQFFTKPWQFTLVLQSDLIGPTKAEFFTRNSEGQLDEHHRDREFIVEPLHAPRVHGRGPSGETAVKATTINHGVPTSAAVRARPESTATHASPRDLSRIQWPVRREVRSVGKGWTLWLSIILAAVLGIFMFTFARGRLAARPKPVTLALRLEDSAPAQLRVDWPQGSEGVRLAHRGELEFHDGGSKSTVTLDPAQLKLGSFTYRRHSGDVKVQLSVYDDGGAATSVGVAEFNGPAPTAVAPPPAVEPQAMDPEKADLEAEIKKLKSQLAAERARREEAQNLVRVLENRLKLAPEK